MRLYLDTNIFYLFLRPPRDMAVLRTWIAERTGELASGVHDAITSPS